MLNKLRSHRIAVRLRTFLQNVYLWETTVSLYHVIKIFIDKLVRFDIDQRASSVAYSFVLAVFPSLIFIFTLIPYIPIRHLDLQIMQFLANGMPPSLYQQTQETLSEIVSKPRGDILSFGFFLALYASTSGMMSLMRAFNMTLHSPENRGLLKARLVALLLTFLLAFVLFISILVLIIGRILIDLLLEEGLLNANFSYYILTALTYLAVFSLFFASVSLIYYFAPAHNRRWKFINIGSVSSSILIILVTNGFSYYLSRFATYNKLYGSIGTLIALMIWLYLIALILIVGFEINASIDTAKRTKG